MGATTAAVRGSLRLTSVSNGVQYPEPEALHRHNPRLLPKLGNAKRHEQLAKNLRPIDLTVDNSNIPRQRLKHR